MKTCFLSVLCLLVLSACQQAPQLQGRAEFAPVGQPPRISQGNHVGISNEDGETRVYGSIGVEAQHQDGSWLQ